jgi:hypothetical protein
MDKIPCPKCGEMCPTAGKNPSGTVRHWCKGCKYKWTPPDQVVEVGAGEGSAKGGSRYKHSWKLPPGVKVEGELTHVEAQKLMYLRKVHGWVLSEPMVLPPVITKDERDYLYLWFDSRTQFRDEERRLVSRIGSVEDEKAGVGVDDWLGRVIKLYSECRSNVGDADGEETFDLDGEGEGDAGEGDEP